METPDSGDEGLYYAHIDIAALRAYRAASRGRALTHPQPMEEICGLTRHASEYLETNVFNRIGASYI
jgi:hypothetical protein